MDNSKRPKTGIVRGTSPSTFGKNELLGKKNKVVTISSYKEYKNVAKEYSEDKRRKDQGLFSLQNLFYKNDGDTAIRDDSPSKQSLTRQSEISKSDVKAIGAIRD